MTPKEADAEWANVIADLRKALAGAAEILEERGKIHGESSRIYARLASAVRGGADDSALAKMLRNEVNSRVNTYSILKK